MANGIIFYQGKSQINGKKIVGIATLKSNNPKTGGLIQTHILVDNQQKPTDNVCGNKDNAICGNCPLKRKACYVNIGQGENQVYRTYENNKYLPLDADTSSRFNNRFLRLGTYGDPTAIPYSFWQQLVSLCKKYVGYTHQWRRYHFQKFRNLCMASVATEKEKREANALGWRTFRVKLACQEVLSDEIICPASEERGKILTCEQCGLCNGNSPERKGTKKNVVINVHGLKWKQNNYRKIINWQ